MENDIVPHKRTHGIKYNASGMHWLIIAKLKDANENRPNGQQTMENFTV